MYPLNDDYLRHGGYVFIIVPWFVSLSVCLFVSLSVCLSVCLLATLRKTDERIFMKFSVEVGLDARNNLKHFKDAPFNALNTALFLDFSEDSMFVSSIAEKTVERFFMNFSEKDGHDRKRNLEHFRDVAVNPLNPGSIYLFRGSVFVCNIMEERVNGFS